MNTPPEPLTYRLLTDRKLVPPLARLLGPSIPRLASQDRLRKIGDFLIACGEPCEADAVVVLGGGRRQRLDHGVELLRDGRATLLVLTSSMAARELRGTPSRNSFEEALRLGVAPTDLIWLPWPLNTFEEAQSLRQLGEELGWARLLVVTEAYHTRRAALTFARAFRGTPLEVRFTCPPASRARLERWWERQREVEVVLSEYLSLGYYLLRRRV